jgi:hypothetical protein
MFLAVRDFGRSKRNSGTRNVVVLVEVLDALRAAAVGDRVRQAETIYQALIEVELTAVIDVAAHERSETRMAQRDGYRPRTHTALAGVWSCVSPSCVPLRCSPACWNAGGGSTRALFAV